MDLLIEKGVDYKTLNQEGGNAFIFASQGTRMHKNGLEAFEYLEGLGLDPKVTTSSGMTSLHALAGSNKNVDVFAYFLAKGLDANQPDGEGRTPLMMASRSNSPEVLAILLEKEGDVELKDSKGNGVAFYLLDGYSDRNKKDFEAKLEILVKAGLSMEQVQSGGNTVWHLAVKKNSMALLNEIAAFDVPVNVKNEEGLTPLHLAAMKATDTRIMEFLIEQGADKSLKTDFDESVYDLALENELLQQQKDTLNFLQ